MSDSKQTSKLPYHPPRITRIVLRRDQAILSACSTGKGDNLNSSGSQCVGSGGCGKVNPAAGMEDNSDSS